jgi:hypothetical protein
MNESLTRETAVTYLTERGFERVEAPTESSSCFSREICTKSVRNSGSRHGSDDIVDGRAVEWTLLGGSHREQQIERDVQ